LETSTLTQIRTTICPACGAEVRLVGRLLIGEVFGCGSCRAPLEVANTDPAVLEPFARVDDGDEAPASARSTS
jgi:lysine biosynthesis protein LysW